MSGNAMHALRVRAGPAALRHLRSHGLRAQDIAVIPAAAGGPKGLILQALDQWLFGSWLAGAPRERALVGASIGAWRMTAACHRDPVSAFKRLGDLYCERQRYPQRPSPQHVSEVCRRILQEFFDGRQQEFLNHPNHRLHVITARSRALSRASAGSRRHAAVFIAAMLANTASRSRLANHFDRIVIGDRRDPVEWLATPFDAFATHFAPLSADNLLDTLLASGTLPLVMAPVVDIAGAPPGLYWDGGMIDYHLALPYTRVADRPENGLVLYPHFNDHIVPGWFDKPLRWRRSGAHRQWLDNMILLSPSPAFVASLPRGKLPDRKDFSFHGLNHDGRIAHWRKAIAEGQRLRDALAALVDCTDFDRVLPL